jgi:23S rRNA pseudouridine1911/1915/1917 synthase
MEITEADVIFEDNHLIAVNKRIGDIIQGDKTGDTPLSDLIKDFLRKKYNKTGNVYCGVIHRIDRPVSGAVIFAKTSKALARMNQLVHDRQIRKHYWAIVKNAPSNPQDELVHYLFKDERKNMVVVSKNPKDGYLKAEMNYQWVASSENYHLLEVELLTGRHHQIRAQLSAIGSPIKGDLKYGFPRSNADASICLHAKSLSFIHPVTLQTTLIKADPPNERIWNCFAEHTGVELCQPPVE